MRDGHLLAEGKPDDLLVKFHKPSLEATFLHLCQPGKKKYIRDESMGDDKEYYTTSPTPTSTLKTPLIAHSLNARTPPRQYPYIYDPDAKRGHTPDTNGSVSDRHSFRDNTETLRDKLNKDSSSQIDLMVLTKDKPAPKCPTPRWKNIKALLWSNYKRMIRNVGFLLFEFLLPSLQVILFCIAIGKSPINLKFNVLNEDTGKLSRAEQSRAVAVAEQSSSRALIDTEMN